MSRYDNGLRGALYEVSLQANMCAPQGLYRYPWISPGPLYRGIGGQWLWDLAYTGWAVARVGRRPDLARGFVRSAVSFREDDGPDRGRLLHAPGPDGKDPALIEGTSQTPLLCWLTARLHELDPDDGFVRAVYPLLAEWIAWWRSPRRDVDGDGLSEYAGPTAKGALHESGIDVGPEKDPVFLAPPPPGPDGLVHDLLADVALNSVLHAECLALADLARVAAASDEQRWRDEAQRIAAAMQSLMWDDHVGAFLPCVRRDLLPAQPRYCRITPMVMLPLWAGVATPEQTRRTIDLLRGEHRAFPTVEGELRIRLADDSTLLGGAQVLTDGLHPAVSDPAALSGVVPGDVDRASDGWVARSAGAEVATLGWPADRRVAVQWFRRLEVVARSSGPLQLQITTGDGSLLVRDLLPDEPVVLGDVNGPPDEEALHGLRSIVVTSPAAGTSVAELVVRWMRPEREGLLCRPGIRSAHPLDGKSPAPGAPTHFWSGSVWAPHVYHVASALRAAGEEPLAHAVARSYADAVVATLELGQGSPEHISADTGAAMGAVPVAWTGAVALLLMEEVLGEPPLPRPVPGDGSAADETTFLGELAGMPADTVMPGGLRAGEVLAFHRRPPTPAGARYTAGLAYSSVPDGRVLRMHVYARSDSSERAPGVVLVHGGGWHGGNPAKHLKAAALLAEQGYVTASIAYRLVPEGRWPAPFDDVSAALRWLREHADELGLDPSRIGIAGDSAGGHLAAMAAAAPQDGADVQAAVLLSPLTDLTDPELISAGLRLVDRLLDTHDPDAARRASPLHHLTSAAPPILTIVGGSDTLTTTAAARRFHDRLESLGATHRLEVWPGLHHAFEFAPSLWQRWFDEVTRWFTTHLSVREPLSVLP